MDLEDMAAQSRAGEEIIRSVRGKIEYPRKRVCSRADAVPGVVEFIRRHLEVSSKDGMPRATGLNTMILFHCDPYLRSCVCRDDATGKLYTEFNEIVFGGSAERLGAIDYLDSCYREVWEHVVLSYDINLSSVLLDRMIKGVAASNYFNSIDDYLDYLGGLYPYVYSDKRRDELLCSLLSYVDLTEKFLTFGEQKMYKRYCFKVLDMWYKKLCNSNAICYGGLFSQVDYANDVVPILIGEQGCGKSTFIDKLVGQELRFFERQSSLAIIQDKDELSKLAGKLVCEIGEIGGASFKDINRVKEFLTKTVYSVRLPYARSHITIVKRWGGIGTSNNAINLLTDRTGNRRWFPIFVDSIDVAGLSQTDIPARLLALYWHRALGRSKKMSVSSYRTFLFRELEEIETPEFLEMAVSLRDDVTSLPVYEGVVEELLNNNKELLFVMDDVYGAVLDRKEYRNIIRGSWRNDVGRVFRKLGWRDYRLEHPRTHARIKTWRHSSNKEGDTWFCVVNDLAENRRGWE